jgi:hypothetical protein
LFADGHAKWTPRTPTMASKLTSESDSCKLGIAKVIFEGGSLPTVHFADWMLWSDTLVKSASRHFFQAAIQLDVAQHAGAGAEGLGLDSHLVQHPHKEVGKKDVVLAVVGQMALVFEAAAGDEDREVGVVV